MAKNKINPTITYKISLQWQNKNTDNRKRRKAATTTDDLNIYNNYNNMTLCFHDSNSNNKQ